MAVWVITGALGSGKTLQAMERIRKALLAGVRVATNIDLNVEHLVPPGRKADIVRLPDHPRPEDFIALGTAYAGPFNEDKFGIIVLDEVAVFLNSRDWQGKDRSPVIAWLRHARKHRWHLILLSQDLESLDKQVRIALAEMVVSCRRGDRLAIPVFSTLVKMLGFEKLTFPQVHIGVVRYGPSIHAPLADRWVLTNARRLWKTYSTSQVIMGEGCAYSVLDGVRAPYLYEPRGLYEFFWKRWGWKWGFAPSAARQRHDDFRLWEAVYASRASSSQTGCVSFAEWALGQAGHPGELGGRGFAAGEARVPDRRQQLAA